MDGEGSAVHVDNPNNSKVDPYILPAKGLFINTPNPLTVDDVEELIAKLQALLPHLREEQIKSVLFEDNTWGQQGELI